MASRARIPTPDRIFRPRDRRRENASPSLKCCCGRHDCLLLRRNYSILGSVEKDAHTAAQLGQVRPSYPLAHFWLRKENSLLLQCAFLLQVFPPSPCTCRKSGYQFVAFGGPFKLSTCIPASLCGFSCTKWLFGNNKTPKGQFSSQNV